MVVALSFRVPFLGLQQYGTLVNRAQNGTLANLDDKLWSRCRFEHVVSRMWGSQLRGHWVQGLGLSIWGRRVQR